MKRSKALLVSTILATLYAVYLVWTFGGAIIRAGGTEFVKGIAYSFEVLFDMLGTDSPSLNFLYALAILLCVHIAVFVLGCIVGWIAYVRRKSGGASFAAALYLIGTICFPLYLIIGLPITIVGFVGGSKQKKLNQAVSEP